MRLSSKVLFHFTKRREWLINCLQYGFLPRYNLEDFSFMDARDEERKKESERFELGVPMTCFCDIRLSQTEEHSSFYGEYIIGLTKEWGNKNGIAPVFYYHPNSPVALFGEIYLDITKMTKRLTRSTTFEGVMKETMRFDKADFDSFNIKNPKRIAANLGVLSSGMQQIASVFKPVDGYTYKQGEGKPVYKYFYDEREWRFLPFFERGMMRDYLPYLLKEQFHDKNFKEAEEKKLHRFPSHCLSFAADDVKYIVVPKAEEILDFQKELKSRLTRLNPESLFHKIRSYEDIKDDF